MVVVDVGANVGIFTLVMARLVGPDGRVHSFEPHPELSRLLRINVELNHYGSICSCVAALVGREDTNSVPFHVSPEGLHVASTICRHPGDWGILRLPMVSLDRYFLHRRRLPSVIKVDGEGAELQILQGAEGVLRRSRPLIVCEVHGKSMQVLGDSIEKLFNFTARLGYKAVNLVTKETVEPDEFAACTRFHHLDPASGQDVAYLQYGHILFAVDAPTTIQQLTATNPSTRSHG